MTTFAEYLFEANGIKTPESKGIAHFDDLDIDLILKVLEKFPQLRALEKMDGVAFRFGLDQDGRLFTTRKGKGGSGNVYEVDDWGKGGITGATNVFKMAHLAIKEIEDEIKQVAEPGDEFDVEIIFGEQPNAVPYGLNGKSYIVFLTSIRDEDHGKIDQIFEKVKDKTSTVNTKILTTMNGREVVEIAAKEDFGYALPQLLDTEQLSKIDLSKETENLKSWLKAINKKSQSVGLNMSNKEVAQMALTGIKKEVKEVMKGERDLVRMTLKDRYLQPIKNKMLDEFVRTLKPHLQDPETENPIGVEGVVFYDADDDIEFKLIDRDVFTAINKFNHEVRRLINGTIISADPDAPLEQRGGIVGSNLVRIHELFNVSGLNTTSSIKRTLRKFKGASESETIDNIAQSLHQSNPGALRRKISAIFDATISELDTALEDFREDRDKYELKLKDGRTIKYTDEIKNRTLSAFAESFERVRRLKKAIMKSATIEDMIVALFEKQIKAIHEE